MILIIYFNLENFFFSESLGNGKEHVNTRLSTLKFLKIKKKVNSCFTNLIIIFLIFQKRRRSRRMFSYSLLFYKVLAKNITCPQVSHALKKIE